MSLINSIHPGDRVTIVDRFGKRRTGRAVMRGTYGWVLNMGGAHGTPGIADHDNVVDVRSKTGKAKYTKSNPGNRQGKWITISVEEATRRAKQSGVKLPKPGGSVYLKWPFKYTLHRDSYGYYIDSPELRSNPKPTPTPLPGENIVYERGWCTVVVDRGLYTVMKNTTTYGYPDSSYKKDADGLSIAKARCDYLFKTHGSGPFSGLRRSTSMRRDGKNPGWKKCTISRSGSAYVVIDQHQRRRSFKRHAAALKYAKKISGNPRRRRISLKRRAKNKRRRGMHRTFTISAAAWAKSKKMAGRRKRSRR